MNREGIEKLENKVIELRNEISTEMDKYDRDIAGQGDMRRNWEAIYALLYGVLDALGDISQIEVCVECEGSGELPGEHVCPPCKGRGTKKRKMYGLQD